MDYFDSYSRDWTIIDHAGGTVGVGEFSGGDDFLDVRCGRSVSGDDIWGI